ncbi:MAG: DNA polymerase III subunit alpha [Bacteroidaceae bacterium]|nr:DNA polymerase III subunit alpha [Bacteroidaceae bacterium]
MEDFIHLHVHSQYSILDGQASIPKMVDKAIKDGMRGMALTDHGNMMGVKDFYNYTEKVIGKAKKELKTLKAKLEDIDNGTYTPSAEEASLSIDEIKNGVNKAIEKQTRIANFKRLIGCEMYVARRGQKYKEGKIDQSGWHLIVIAKNITGYKNLIKLVSNAWVVGFYMRPRTDHEQLQKYHEGLMVSSACLAGEVSKKITNNDIEGAEETILWYKNIFGDDFYLELMRHKVTDPAIFANREVYPLQEICNQKIIELARKHGVKLVCTNDTHFVDEENAEAHDRLICLSTSKDLDDRTRMVYTKQEWFKTKAEMNQIFADVPEALSNTCELAEKTENYSIDHGPIMPNFDIPESFGTEEEYRKNITTEQLYDEFTQDENGNVVLSREEGEEKIKKLGGYDKLYRIKFEADYLAKLAYEGAKWRYGDPLNKETQDRIKFELHIMKTMGFPGYFLIVQDYIKVAREQLGVSVGPGRGSAAGSAVAYCLRITDIDPIKYDLLFERFLNPDRISLPDIDVDFDDDGRGKVLQWVTDKYGADRVAHIITYGTMATKSAIKDVARVQKLPLDKSNYLCKLIPDKLPEGPDGKTPKMNLPNAIAAIPELREAESSPDPLLHNTIRYAKMLEGNVRNTGVHACGVIICKDPISDWVPVSTAEDKATKEKLLCTQYEGKVIEETGLIKMDFLGLKTLSIIKETIQNIEDSLHISLDIDQIPIDDPATFQLYCDGRTVGTFQFESPGMQKYLRELEPSVFEDLIAMNALYRPGPMQYIPEFINRKKGISPIIYDLPCMEKYLKDTYGITVYQEQVMLLSREIADFTRGESDNLRKAMGKKLIDKLNHMYPKFLEGGKRHGYDPKVLEKIWEDWRAFASYAFNKSHATCYSWVAYQTAYLKANYPSQYMAGVMSRSLDNITDITKLMEECKTMSISTLPPDINESKSKFSVNALGDIRFGLEAIKGVGEAAVYAILEERKKRGVFTSVYNFFERINLNACNKKNIENIILAGGFDGFKEYKREQFLEPNDSGETFLDMLVKYGQNYQLDRLCNQVTLFGTIESIEIAKPKPPVHYREWSNLERLNKERDLIGIYISAHPLDSYKVVLNKLCQVKMENLQNRADYANQDIVFGGIVTEIVRNGLTKTGKPFGIVKIEDYSGSGELALFGEDWAHWNGYFTVGNTLYISAKVEPQRYNPNAFDLRITKIDFLSDIKENRINKITIQLPLNSVKEEDIHELISIIQNEQGKVDLCLNIIDVETKANIDLLSKKYKSNLSKELIDFLDKSNTMTYKIN